MIILLFIHFFKINTMNTNNTNTLKLANSLKSHENYTLEEIMNYISIANNQYEYDSIIDSLYLKDRDDNRDTKNRRDYSYHTADSMRQKRKREESLNYLNEVKHIQLSKH